VIASQQHRGHDDLEAVRICVSHVTTGEEVDDHKRAAMLAQSLQVITRAWTHTSIQLVARLLKSRKAK